MIFMQIKWKSLELTNSNAPLNYFCAHPWTHVDTQSMYVEKPILNCEQLINVCRIEWVDVHT